MACSCERFLDDDCPDCNHSPLSFTDEDVERVADVLSRDRMAEGDDPPEPFGYWTGELDRRLARAALEAFVEQATKGDT